MRKHKNHLASGYQRRCPGQSRLGDKEVQEEVSQPVSASQGSLRDQQTVPGSEQVQEDLLICSVFLYRYNVFCVFHDATMKSTQAFKINKQIFYLALYLKSLLMPVTDAKEHGQQLSA